MRSLALAAVLALSGCAALGQKFNINDINIGDTISAGQDALKAMTLTDEEVQQHASQIVQELDAESEVAPPGSPYSKRLEKIVARHKNEDGLNLNYKVYVDPEVNAFALADGSVRVHTGLMDKMTDDEVLFVIGHEIGHVKAGHVKSRMQRALAASAAVGAAKNGLNASVNNSVGGVGAAIGGHVLSDIVSEVLQAQFSQSDETESDENGLALLQKMKRPAEAAVKALTKLADNHGNESETSKFFAQFTSTHPDPLARAEHIQELIVAGGGQPVQVASESGASKAVSTPSEDASVKDASVAVPAATGSAGEIAFGAAEVAAPAALVTASEPSSEVIKRSPTPKGAGWFVQVGAFSVQENAVRLQESLSNRGASVQVRESARSGRKLYRVIVGPFDTREVAEKEGSGLGDTTDWVIRHSGSF